MNTTTAPATPIATGPSHALSGTVQAIAAAYAKAYQRATEARLIAFRNVDGSFDVPSASTPGDVHQVVVTGRRFYDMTCSCKGGNHVACMHRAVVAHSRKYGVIAIRPTPHYCTTCHLEAVLTSGTTCPGCLHVAAARADGIPPSTAEEVAASAAIAREVMDDLLTECGRVPSIPCANCGVPIPDDGHPLCPTCMADTAARDEDRRLLDAWLRHVEACALSGAGTCPCQTCGVPIPDDGTPTCPRCTPSPEESARTAAAIEAWATRLASQARAAEFASLFGTIDPRDYSGQAVG